MSQSLLRRILILLLSLFTVACTKDSTSQPPPSDKQGKTRTSEIFRGHIVFGHEVRSFRECGSEDALWVDDQTGLLWDVHQELAPKNQPYEEVFFSLLGRSGPPPRDGFGADYSGELVVEEILYAALEGFSCDTEWTKFNFRAFGNEPYWSVEVTEQRLELRRLGEPDILLGYPREKRVGKDAVFTVDDVTLEVSSGPCRDSMSGAFFGYRATLRFGAEQFQGCGLKGEAVSPRLIGPR